MANPDKLFSVLYGAVAILSVISYGCMVGPNYQRPNVTVSQNWIESGDKRAGTGAADYRNWWKTFNDPVLDHLIDQAYKENLPLQIAGLRVLEARAQLGIAVGELYPQSQQAFGNLQYNRPSGHAPQTILGSNQGFWQSEIGLSASWELDFWGKFRRAVESDNASWLASIANYDSVLVSLTADVANSYIQIRTLEKRIDIARRNVETQRESLKIAEVRYRYGAVSQLDVDQAGTALYDTEASIPPLEIQLRQANNALSVLLGLPPSHLTEELAGPSEIPVSPVQVIVGIPADLLRRRPDIRFAELLAAAQCARIGVAKADLYPAFSLGGVLGFLSSDFGPFKLSDMFQWSSRSIQTGPSFQWSIFNYGQITNNVRVQDARFQEFLINYQNTVLTAQRDVEDNLAAFLRAQERADHLAKSTQAAKSALDLAIKQYRQGTKDFTTVLIAQQSLLSEQDSLASTLGEISLGLVGVYKAIGGGWEIREGKELVSPAITEEMKERTNWGGLLMPASYNPPITEKPSSSIRAPDW